MTEYSALPVGTKVIRGPTWRWGNQDHSGVGEVLPKLDEPCEDFTLRVRWPDGSTNGYRYTVRYKDVVSAKSSKTFKDLL